MPGRISARACRTCASRSSGRSRSMSAIASRASSASRAGRSRASRSPARHLPAVHSCRGGGGHLLPQSPLGRSVAPGPRAHDAPARGRRARRHPGARSRRRRLGRLREPRRAELALSAGDRTGREGGNP
jgi:hypothetical protein